MLYSTHDQWFSDVASQSLYNVYYRDAIVTALSKKWKEKSGNVTLTEGKEEAVNVIKKNWVAYLKSKQQYFVDRLGSRNDFLLYEHQNHFSELTIVTRNNEIVSVNDFLKISNTAFRLNNEKNYKEESWLKGKIAEIVVKHQLADLLTEVDYNFYPNSGDGGVDFKLLDSPDIGIQVKTRWLRDYEKIANVEWSFKQNEIKSNQVFLCLLLLNPDSIDKLQVVLAGFTTSKLLSSKQGVPVSWNDLLYCGGLRDHLLYLKSQDPGFLLCDLEAEEYFKCAVTVAQIDEVEKPPLFHYRLLASLYSKAIELDRENHWLYNRRAFVYTQMQDHLAALDDLNSAIQIEPKFIQGYMNRAFEYQATEQYQQAIEDYNKVIKFIIKKDEYFNFVNSKFLEVEKVGKSSVIHFDTLNLSNLFYAYFSRGCCYRFVGDYERAVQDFTDAIKHFMFNINLSYELNDTYYERALALLNLGMLEEAIQDCNQAIAINNTFGKYYGLRGFCYAALNDKRALVDFEVCRQLSFFDGSCLLREGIFLHGLDCYEQAILVLDQALEVGESVRFFYVNFEFTAHYYQADSYLCLAQDLNLPTEKYNELYDRCLENCYKALDFSKCSDFIQTNITRDMIARLLYMKGLCLTKAEDSIESFQEALVQATNSNVINMIERQIEIYSQNM